MTPRTKRVVHERLIIGWENNNTKPSPISLEINELHGQNISKSLITQYLLKFINGIEHNIDLSLPLS